MLKSVTYEITKKFGLICVARFKTECSTFYICIDDHEYVIKNKDGKHTPYIFSEALEVLKNLKPSREIESIKENKKIKKNDKKTCCCTDEIYEEN